MPKTAPQNSHSTERSARFDAASSHNTTRTTQASIPTDDPAAALHFCRQLAALLSSELAGSLGQLTDQESDVCPALSVVIPIYNEEGNIPELYARLTEVLTATEPNYEIIFIDDGSRDASPALLRNLVDNDAHIIVVEFARNFGHQVAISAGLDHARGDGVIVMDGDLQDPPEVLPAFIAKWREGADVVYAVREKRKESWPKRFAYHLFYRILRAAANIEVPLDSGDFCIMDRRVVDLIRSLPERNRFIRGIRSWTGFTQVGLRYERHGRNAGKTKYSLSRLIVLALDGLVSFSHMPLRIVSLLGIGISFISMLLALGYFIKKLTSGLTPPGFATLVVAIFFFAGVQLITIGVVGEYVGRIFDEVKQRPLYIVRHVRRQMR